MTRSGVPLLCPSTIFRIARANVPMVRMIVGRCNVGESTAAVEEYAASRLNPGALPWQVDMVKRLARILHRHNRRLYREVMS